MCLNYEDWSLYFSSPYEKMIYKYVYEERNKSLDEASNPNIGYTEVVLEDTNST